MKWIEVMLFHKKQQEALDSQMKSVTKEKKEKDNALIGLELINLKNVSLLQSKELKRNIVEAEKE